MRKIRRVNEKVEREGIQFNEPSLTQQHFKESVNINSIIEKYKRTGILPVQKMNPQFGDFSNVEDYREAVQKILDVQDEFYALPAKVREKFKNDPSELLDFVSNEENREEAISLGLIEQPEKAPEIKRTGEPIVEPEIMPDMNDSE